MASWQEDVQNALNELAGAITAGKVAVDASGFVIEADIIDADMDAITGTAPSSATLHDILTGQESGGALYDLLEANLHDSGGMMPWLQSVIYELDAMLSDGMAMQPYLQTVVDYVGYVGDNTYDGWGSMMTVAEAAANTYYACDYGLYDGGGSMNPYLYDIRSQLDQYLMDQSAFYGAADWVADLVDDGGRTGAASPLHDTDSPNLPAADILGDIYGKINTMESNIAAVKAQTDKLTFDGSNHLEVHTN